MSSTPEFEPVARQDYGPTTSTTNEYEDSPDHKLADNMSIPGTRTPVLRAVPISPTQANPEPDSTDPENVSQVASSEIEKEVEYHIAEKSCDADMTDSLAGLVRIEETTVDNVGRITYPIIQETDDSSDNYIENTSTTLIQAPLSTAIVQNVAKLPQNFTINVDGTVGNITTIQNMSQDVSSGSQTLWLPTILATSTGTDKSDEDGPHTGVSQIIITSESYVTSEIPRRANIVTETNYINRSKAPKVQILSNISIPKTPTYTAQFQSAKDLTAPLYSTQNHVYKLNTSVVTPKHFNNSVLNTKSSKNQSLIGCPTVVNNSQVKGLTYGHTFSKSTNLNKVNKVNNGANLNSSVPAQSNTQCHILSRVVSGPNKLSVHTSRKSAGTLKGSKNASALSGNQKQSRAIKIIQQTGSAHKVDKNWPVASVTTYKSQQPAYNVVDTNNSKIIQKIGSPTHKPQPMSLQKVGTKGDRLILQSPCGPVLISTAPMNTTMPKGPHYVQSSGQGPSLRYVQTYSTEAQMSQAAVNQQLTAQILQSLSQPPKRMHTNHIINHTLPSIIMSDEPMDVKPQNQKRIVFGDPSTLLTTDDVIGMEERPNLSEEFRRYSFQPLAFVMLDHNYALPAQKQPSPTPISNTPISTVITSTTVTSPPSPMKKSSPVISSLASYDLPNPLTTSVIGSTIPGNQTLTEGLNFKPQLTQQDDDAGSVISSLGDRKEDRGGSDTETAPEVEEEGKTRCICDFTHDDGYMICCDRCGEWQHVDCMGIDRDNIPDAYMCEICLPRHVDRRHARAIQMRKREELSALGASDTDSSDCGRPPGQKRKKLLTVTTYSNTSGTSVSTFNPLPPAPPTIPTPTLPLPKRGPKRPKKTEIVRKGTKRKMTEKRVKRKKDMLLNRNKFHASSTERTNQSHWQESYESAVTNHYSPELRAKMMKYSSKLGNTANMAAAITAHLCTTVPHAGGKILIATKDLRENTPIIELRGKYMLSNQHRPQLQNSARMGSQKPGPFVFFYRLPKDNIQICIDTRTYGNEARFVRRSCKPNAELQHCITKGAVHVYLVTISSIQSDTEITVGHDNNSSKQPCACGNPKHCKVNGVTPIMSRRNIEYPQREKRSRNRCSSSSSPASPPPVPVPNLTTPTKESVPFFSHIKSEKKSPIKKEDFALISPFKRSIPTLNLDQPIKIENEPKEEDNQPMKEIDLIAKEEMKPDFDEPDFVESPKKETAFVKLTVEKPVGEKTQLEEEIKEILKEVSEQKKEKKLAEEPKLVPKLELPKDEKPKDEQELKKEPELFSDEEKPIKKEKFFSGHHKEDKASAKSACHDRSSRSSRTMCVNQDSLDDKTDDSQDKPINEAKEKDKRKMTREERKMEAIMKAFERMEKAQQRKQEVKERQKRRDSDPHPNNLEKDDDEVHKEVKKRRKRKGRARTTSQSNRRRLNSADSDMATSGDEAVMTSPRGPSRRNSSLAQHNTSNEDKNDSVGEDVNLSSACLLVEAAVGSVESAFKLPKTKKTMVNEWVGRSPERTPSPYRSPYRPSLVPATSLESLVRVASTMIGDLSGGQSEHEDALLSPPRTPVRDRSKPPKKFKRVTRSTPPTEVVEAAPAALPLSQHSAKKRWLRQAISEESDAPNVESPPSEMVTPLKKRRLARESLSCEQNHVPTLEETSPNFPIEDSPIKEDKTVARPFKIRNLNETLYTRDRSRSDSGQGSDDQSHLDHDVLNVDLKVPPDSENIRRIIGVPGTEDLLPAITKIEDIKSLNNNVGDTTECNETGYSKVMPMEIDTTILPQPQIKECPADKQNRTESPQDKLHSSQSADTSGNSSPQRDEMDDIQKKIHSFHTENILMLKSRNKKTPKEKRKKVNLNFDLNMVDDQISIQLRTGDEAGSKSPEINGDLNDEVTFVMENIPLPPVETIPLPNPESIPLPSIPPPEAIPLPQKPLKAAKLPLRGLSSPLVVENTEPTVSNTDVSLMVEKSTDVDKFSNLESQLPICEDKLPSREEKLLIRGEKLPLCEDLLPKREEKRLISEEKLPVHEKNLPICQERLPVCELRVSPGEEKPLLRDEKVNDHNSTVQDKPSTQENSTLSFSSRFSSTGLFSGIFSNINQSLTFDTQINDNVPNMQMIKSAIDRTTSLDSNIFDNKDISSPVDELKNVQEILSRVNSMDSNNSVLLCGVLKGSEQGTLTSVSSPPKPAKPYCPRTNDPRLNPPPSDKPKPIRRKLSISEYRKRHKGSTSLDSDARTSADASNPGEWSSESSGAGSLSPLRLEAAAAAAADDLEQRLHRAFTATTPKGVFDAQPTASERQREKLSARLRREFGLSLVDDEAARPPTEPADITPTPTITDEKRCER